MPTRGGGGVWHLEPFYESRQNVWGMGPGAYSRSSARRGSALDYGMRAIVGSPGKDCAREYDVPGLARDCEARHAAQLALVQAS